MAAPSSAHTRPSAMARMAPTIHPMTACGPPIVATMIGMVMNGPMPHIWVILIAVPENTQMERWKALSRTGFGALESCMLALSKWVAKGSDGAAPKNDLVVPDSARPGVSPFPLSPEWGHPQARSAEGDAP